RVRGGEEHSHQGLREHQPDQRGEGCHARTPQPPPAGRGGPPPGSGSAMNLNQLFNIVGAKKVRKRCGRGEGSGLGKTSGRGNKGAKSRSGWRRLYGYEGGQ